MEAKKKEDEKDINEMTMEELREKIIKQGGTIEQLKRDYLANYEYCKRLMYGMAKALEPMVFFHLAPWVSPNQYLNEIDKKTILRHLAKMCVPLARVLAPAKPEKQLQSLVQQAYSTFVEAYALVDYNAKITWQEVIYRVKDKKGLEPYTLQVDGGCENKTPYHRAPLAKLLKAMEAEADETKPPGEIAEDEAELPPDEPSSVASDVMSEDSEP